MPSKFLSIFAIIIAFTLTSCGLIPTQASSAIESVNVDQSRLAIKGYDPVAYFTQAAPVEGLQQFTAEYNGAVYQFPALKIKLYLMALPLSTPHNMAVTAPLV
jgi:hypothetical protein